MVFILSNHNRDKRSTLKTKVATKEAHERQKSRQNGEIFQLFLLNLTRKLINGKSNIFEKALLALVLLSYIQVLTDGND